MFAVLFSEICTQFDDPSIYNNKVSNSNLYKKIYNVINDFNYECYGLLPDNALTQMYLSSLEWQIQGILEENYECEDKDCKHVNLFYEGIDIVRIANRRAYIVRGCNDELSKGRLKHQSKSAYSVLNEYAKFNKLDFDGSELLFMINITCWSKDKPFVIINPGDLDKDDDVDDGGFRI